MKKKYISIIFLCLILICGFMGWKSFTSHSRILKTNWGFSLPLKAFCREIYIENGPPSFHGDGIRYRVYAYKHEDEIAHIFPWSGPEGPTIFEEAYPEALENWLDQIDVPSQWRPGYDEGNCSYWYQSRRGNSQIIVVMDQKLNRLYIAESFL